MRWGVAIALAAGLSAAVYLVWAIGFGAVEYGGQTLGKLARHVEAAGRNAERDRI